MEIALYIVCGICLLLCVAFEWQRREAVKSAVYAHILRKERSAAECQSTKHWSMLCQRECQLRDANNRATELQDELEQWQESARRFLIKCPKIEFDLPDGGEECE